MTYNQAITNLANSIFKSFDEVFFNAETVVINNTDKFPAISVNSEWINLSPTDQKETLYIRRDGDDEILQQLKLGSCEKAYQMKSPLRVVFFKDNATDHELIFSKLRQTVLISKTQLRAIRRNKWNLLKQESSGNYNFGPMTFYIAFDIYVLWELIPESCEDDFCSDIVNPLKRLPCSAIVA